MNGRVAIILGQTLNPDGRIPQAFKSRLLAAQNLLQIGRIDHIILTGSDVAKTGISEARAGLEFLKSFRERISLEEISTDTIGNALHTLPILEKLNPKEILLVTSEFHMPRSLYVFEAVLGGKLFHKVTPHAVENAIDSPKDEPQDNLDFGARKFIPDINKWGLMSRLRHEQACVDKLMDEMLTELSIPIPPQSSKDRALLRVDHMLQSSRNSG